MMKLRKTYVLVVGGGPTGITTGLYLEKFGIPHLLIEKDLCMRRTPKAHYYNNQTMEVWRGISHLDRCVRNETENIEYWKSFNYGLGISKDITLGTFNNFYEKYMYNGTYYEDISPSKVTHVSQYKVVSILYYYYMKKLQKRSNETQNEFKKRLFLKDVKLKLSTYRMLENILREKTKDTNKIKEDITTLYDASNLLLGYEFVDFEKIEANKYTEVEKREGEKEAANQNFIITKVRNTETKEEEWVLSDYVFVAEGGKSKIKDLLNINDEHKKSYMKFVNIHFSSEYLSRLIRFNPAMLYFLFNKYMGVLVCHHYQSGEVVLHIPYVTEQEKKEYSDRSHTIQLINEVLGFPLNDIQLHDVTLWTMNSSIASTFLDHKSNRIFLLGDSAHKLPPSGGFGLNLGIGDVLNICWKIVRVFKMQMDAISRNGFKSIELKTPLKQLAKGCSYVSPELEVEMQKRNHNYSLLTFLQHKQIQYFFQSYNIERKLVAKFTIESAVRRYEKGRNIPNQLGYNQKIIEFLNKCTREYISKSFLFHTIFKSAKNVLYFINTIPFIYEQHQKKINALFRKPSELLMLLAPEVDFCYAYLNTIEMIDTEKETQKKPIIKRNQSLNQCNQQSIYEKEKNPLPKLKVVLPFSKHRKPNHVDLFISDIIGIKIPHFSIYGIDKNYVYKYSTVDLPLLNNPHFSYVILLFDTVVLKHVLEWLITEKIPTNKFSFCLWDAEVTAYKDKDGSIKITNREKEIESVQLENTSIKIKEVFTNKSLTTLGKCTNIKHIQMDTQGGYIMNYAFSSSVIRDMFLNYMNLKLQQSFIILRPDRHIIGVGEKDMVDQIKKFCTTYI